MSAVVQLFPTRQGEPPVREVCVADLDDGYTKTANDIQKMKCKIRLSGREHNILEAIIYSTYGWNKKQDRLTNTYLANMCDMDPSDVNKALIELGKRKVITIQKIGVMKLVGINKIVSDWVLDKQPKPKKQDSIEKGKNTQNLGETTQTDGQICLSNRAKLPNTQYSLTQDNINTKDHMSENSDEFTNESPSEQLVLREEKPSKIKPGAAIQTQSGGKWGSADDLKAAEYIHANAKQVSPTIKNANWADWANTVRLMREVDGRTHREICELFRFANKHHFWCVNVLSPQKLRQQWDRLVAERLQNPNAKKQTSTEAWDESARDTSWANDLGGY